MKTVVICGATATGKTDLAVEIAKMQGGEVISADCMLVYRGLDIGTAKPTEEEKCGVAHHMIDVVSPFENYSVGDYEKAALPILEKLVNEGKVPVVCGGTGFYIQSLLFKRGNGNVASDADIRKKYELIEKEQGREFLHSMLEKVDPESAEKLHFNDVKRVVRALEIYELTGRKKSEQDDGFSPRRDYVAFAFDFPREVLYERIERRVDKMLEDGLVEEVENLYRSGVDEKCQSMQGIGYKEVLDYLKNRVSYSTMSDIIKQNTRNYAKRQITFFKKLPGLVWLDPFADRKEIISQIMRKCEI